MGNLTRFALSIGVAALFAGCGGSQSPIAPGAMGAMPQVPALNAQTSRFKYKVVHSFREYDGANPYGGLTNIKGTLYGTTLGGGDASYQSCVYYYFYGCGTVFSVTPGGVETVVHSFGAGSDGFHPRSRLLEVHGALYGTTMAGGSYPCYGSHYANCGTLFTITPSGTEQVLHNFGGREYGGDGAEPYGGLIDVHGTLYGTTTLGGGYCANHSAGCGTVFSITTGGSERVLYDFTGSPDGAHPTAGLIDIKGTLYGTTESGGQYGYGTVFSITSTGVEKVLHSFGAGNDGRTPEAALIELGGKLYGTTAFGGALCGSIGCGTVFSITLNGNEKLLHNFGSGADGKYPYASLVAFKRRFYGTTLTGGGKRNKGTIFTVTPGGTERVLHSFSGRPGGANPRGELINVNGALYGTASAGGTYGEGVIFSLAP